MQIKVRRLNRIMLPLLLILIILDFDDILFTVVAMTGPGFVEFNQIAAALFDMKFWGFIAALVLKYSPLIPLSYGALFHDRPNRPVQVRVVKLGTLVALLVADVLTATVVASDGLVLLSFLSHARA